MESSKRCWLTTPSWMPALVSDFDHAPRHVEIGRHRLLHLDVLLGCGATLHRFQAEFGEGAHIDVIDTRMPAQFLEIGDEFASVTVGERAGAVGMEVGASHHFIADIGVSARMLVSNSAGSDDADPHASYCDMARRAIRLRRCKAMLS